MNNSSYVLSKWYLGSGGYAKHELQFVAESVFFIFMKTSLASQNLNQLHTITNV